MKGLQVKYLGLNGEEYDLSKFKIVAGMCTLNGFPKDFFDYFIKTALCNIFESVCTIESAILPMARNQVIALAYANSPDFTHILFLDSDMSEFCGEHVAKLVEANVSIISGACTLRRPPYTLVNPFAGKNDDEAVIEYMKSGDVHECTQVGMAFTLIKKEVFDAVQGETSQGPVWFNIDRLERDGFEAEIEEFIESKLADLNKSLDEHKCYTDETLREAIVMGQTSHLGSPILGEDITFSRKAKKLGFNCYTHCGVIVGHLGTRAYNFADTLANNDKVIA